jgi:hypothetical protein
MFSNVTFHRPPPSRLTPGSVGVVSPPSVLRKEHVRVPRIPGAVLDPVERRAGLERLGVLTRARLVPVDLGEVELDRIALADPGPELGVGRHPLVQCVEHVMGSVVSPARSKALPRPRFVPRYIDSWLLGPATPSSSPITSVVSVRL